LQNQLIIKQLARKCKNGFPEKKTPVSANMENRGFVL